MSKQVLTKEKVLEVISARIEQTGDSCGVMSLASGLLDYDPHDVNVIIKGLVASGELLMEDDGFNLEFSLPIKAGLGIIEYAEQMAVTSPQLSTQIKMPMDKEDFEAFLKQIENQRGVTIK
jgi:hypothetical protein